MVVVVVCTPGHPPHRPNEALLLVLLLVLQGFIHMMMMWIFLVTILMARGEVRQLEMGGQQGQGQGQGGRVAHLLRAREGMNGGMHDPRQAVPAGLLLPVQELEVAVVVVEREVEAIVVIVLPQSVHLRVLSVKSRAGPLRKSPRDPRQPLPRVAQTKLMHMTMLPIPPHLNSSYNQIV